MTKSPQICEELVIASNAFFHFPLYIMRLLVTMEGTSALSLEEREGTVKRQQKEVLPVRTLILYQNVFWYLVFPTWEAQC